MAKMLILFLMLLLSKQMTAINHFEQTKNHEMMIAARSIISNYMTKYFNDSLVYISILTASESNEQHQIQQDLITDLMADTLNLKFSFELRGTQEILRRHRQSFSLLFIDGLSAFW